MYSKVIGLKEKIYANQTGPFPFTSSKGNRYVMVAIHVDTSYIFVEPMKNRTSGHMIEMYQRIIERMTASGLGLKKHYLDNKASEDFKTAIEKNDCEFEKVAPGNHRCIIAERVIQTAKDHFISVLAGCDTSFPMHLCC